MGNAFGVPRPDLSMEMQKYDAARHNIMKMSFKIHLFKKFSWYLSYFHTKRGTNQNSNFAGELNSEFCELKLL